MGVKKEVTIYDIAKSLKLSPATVSRALSGFKSIPAHTRARVTKAADDLGYRNPSAKTKKSNLIAAMVTQLNTSIASDVLTGAEMIVSPLGYNMIVRQSMNKPELRAANIESLRNHKVDGVLVTSAYFQEYASLKEFAKLKKPLVVIELSSMLPNRPKKKGDELESAYELTEYLIKKGCAQIGYLLGDSNSAEDHQPLVAGYRKALQNYKLPDANVLVSHDFENTWLDMCRMLVSMTPRLDGIIISNRSITVLAFSDTDSFKSNGYEFWITCRKGGTISQTKLLIDLGKIAAGLLICLTERMQALPGDKAGLITTPDMLSVL